MSALPEHIQLKCPHCGAPLKQAPLMRSATLLLNRKCRKCSTQWRLKVVPMRWIEGSGGFLTQIEWTVA